MNVTVVDVRGDNTPTVTVTLRYVGGNDHSPVVHISSEILHDSHGVLGRKTLVYFSVRECHEFSGRCSENVTYQWKSDCD